jgi:hypothetical protein
LLNQRKHAAPDFMDDWHKYGPENFSLVTLEEIPGASVEEKRNHETKWFDHYRNMGKLYNKNLVSFNSAPGAIRKAIEAARVANTGRYHSPEERAKRAASHRGKRHTPESIAKMSAVKKALGQKPTPEAARAGGYATLEKYGPLWYRRQKED